MFEGEVGLSEGCPNTGSERREGVVGNCGFGDDGTGEFGPGEVSVVEISIA